MSMAGSDVKSATRILLVEDSLLVAQEIEHLLIELGYAVVGPHGRVREALEAARSLAIDGAVLDVNLDGELVFPVARELARREIPFIFATGYDLPIMPTDLADRLRILKPFNRRELGQAVTRMFGAGT